MAVVMRDHSVTYQPLTTHTHTHTRLKALCPGLPGWAGTRKVKPIWILLKQETVSGSGISWASRKFASCSRQITTPVPHHSVFYRPDALPVAQPTASKHWRHSATNMPPTSNHSQVYCKPHSPLFPGYRTTSTSSQYLFPVPLSL